jgi:hypothetical protein
MSSRQSALGGSSSPSQDNVRSGMAALNVGVSYTCTNRCRAIWHPRHVVGA